MNKEESDKIIEIARQWDKKISAKEKQVNDLLEYADGIFDECNRLINEITEYLQSPVNYNLEAPIPAFRGKPSPEVGKSVVDKLAKLMKEATPLLEEITAYRNRYKFYLNHRTDCMKEFNDNIANPGAKPKWAKLLKPAEKLPEFYKQADKFLPAIPDFQVKLKNIRNQINVLMDVN